MTPANQAPGWEKSFGEAQWNLWRAMPQGVFHIGGARLINETVRINVDVTAKELDEFRRWVLPQMLHALGIQVWREATGSMPDELPEESVLVQMADGAFCVAAWDSERKCFSFSLGGYRWEEVTHWRPIDKPDHVPHPGVREPVDE